MEKRISKRQMKRDQEDGENEVQADPRADMECLGVLQGIKDSRNKNILLVVKEAVQWKFRKKQ